MNNRISYKAVPAEDPFQKFYLVEDETCRFVNSDRKPLYVCSASVMPPYSTRSGITHIRKEGILNLKVTQSLSFLADLGLNELKPGILGQSMGDEIDLAGQHVTPISQEISCEISLWR